MSYEIKIPRPLERLFTEVIKTLYHWCLSALSYMVMLPRRENLNQPGRRTLAAVPKNKSWGQLIIIVSLNWDNSDWLFQKLAFSLVASFVYWTGLDSLWGTVAKKWRKKKIKKFWNVMSENCFWKSKHVLCRQDNRVEWLKYKTDCWYVYRNNGISVLFCINWAEMKKEVQVQSIQGAVHRILHSTGLSVVL